MLIGATIFYMLAEGWPVVDSLYFAFVTGLTIGYGDLAPTTPLSKVFTILYALLAIGLFVTVGTPWRIRWPPDVAVEEVRTRTIPADHDLMSGPASSRK